MFVWRLRLIRSGAPQLCHVAISENPFKLETACEINCELVLYPVTSIFIQWYIVRALHDDDLPAAPLNDDAMSPHGPSQDKYPALRRLVAL